MSGGRHPDDGALMRSIDGEPSGPGDTASHLAECATCRQRLAALEERTRQVDGALERTRPLLAAPAYDRDFMAALAGARGAAAAVAGPPTREGTPGRARAAAAPWWRWRHRARLAAAIAVLALVGLVPPVRAWVVQGLERVRAALVTEPAPRPTASAAVPTEVVMTETGPLLTLRASASQAPDSVVFRRTEETRVRAALQGGGGDAEVLVRSDGFEIRAGPGAFVIVWTPVAVREVRVVVDGEELARGDIGSLAEASADWTVRIRPAAAPGREPNPPAG
jgi:hypothetical protein